MAIDVFPFQHAGGVWLAQRERGGCLDPMGLGKTATAIRALDLRRIRRGLIIAPANLRTHWIGELHKFAQYERRLCKGVTLHDFVAWKKGRYETMVTSYEMAVRWAPLLHGLGETLEFVIFDEWHYLKNHDAKRTRAMLGLGFDGHGGILQMAEQSWCLTGTLMPNDPIDCYTFLRYTRATTLRRDPFIDRYMVPRYNTSRLQAKPDMVPELQALIGNNSIRRTEQDVEMELPPILLTTLLVDGDTAEIREFLREFPGLDGAILEALEMGGLSFLDAQHVETLRRLLGEAKAIPYAGILYDELMTGLDKMVVMATHRKAINLVHDYLTLRNIWTVQVHGDTTAREMDAAIHNFQSDRRCRVFVGQTQKTGVGLTLHASAHLDMLENNWSPGANAQAVFRVRKIGQTRSVRARFITLARSFDETVNRIVVEKTTNIAEIEGVRLLGAPADLC